MLAGSLVLAIGAGAHANRLDGESLGEDWLMAGVEEQVAWGSRDLASDAELTRPPVDLGTTPVIQAITPIG